MSWHRGWPVATPMPMFESQAGAASVKGEAQTDGSIAVEVISEDRSMRVRSARLNPKSSLFRFGIAWKFPDDLCVVANGQIIASLLPLASPLPETIDFPEPKLRTPKDFASENARALQARKEAINQLTAKPGNRLRTPDEELEFLSDAIAQLKDHVAAIEKGQAHHLIGCASSVRSLIARGGRNFKPLLQRVAGRLNEPLLLYVPIHTDDPLATTEPKPSETYLFQVAAKNLEMTTR